MKKLFMVTLLATLLVGSVFAKGKTYVIDLGDSLSKQISIVKNPYGTNYQCSEPAKFTKLLKGNMPSAGDIVEVHYKLKTNKDLKELTLALVDNSEKASWWLLLSPQYEKILDIKANTEYTGVLTFELDNTPIQDFTVQFMYDETVNSKVNLLKAGVTTGEKK